MMKADRHVGMLAAGLALLGLALGCSESEPASPAGGGGERPLRILSLTPNVTEILFAMGLGDRVVGRSTCCDEPPEARALPAVGDTLQIRLNEIIRLEPTVAFLLARPEAVKHDAVLRRLEGLGIRVVPLQADRMDEMFEAIRTIGRQTGRQDAARALVARIESDLEAVRRRVAGLTRPRVLFAFPMTVGSARVMVAGRGTFVDGLLDVAGAENAYPRQAHWPTISPQQVVELAPEVVIINAVGDDTRPDRLEAIRAGWASLAGVPAVARRRVHILTEPYLTIPGPRVGQAARLLAETIHPELRGGREGAKP
jgi:iron complex transport system substrate-binding protein